MLTMNAVRTNPLLGRLDEAERARGLSSRAWSLAAGLSDTYVKQQRARAVADPNFVLPEKHAPDLARAAGVRLEWLRFGRGPRDAPADELAPAVEAQPVSSPMQVREPRSVDVALLRAYREGHHTEGDVLAALSVLQTGRSMLPDDPHRAVVVAGNILTAVSRLRRDGRLVTFESLVWSLAQGGTQEMNAEGVAQLRELGGEPPAQPVRPPAPAEKK
jgi:hypothetical protein